MATFDEKEFLWEDLYQDIKYLMSKKRSLDQDSTEEWLIDFKKLNDFRDKIADTPPENINYQESLNFFFKLENKYKTMPDMW